MDHADPELIKQRANELEKIKKEQFDKLKALDANPETPRSERLVVYKQLMDTVSELQGITRSQRIKPRQL